MCRDDDCDIARKRTMRCKHYNAFGTVVSASINNTAVRNPQQLCIDTASPGTYQRPFTVASRAPTLHLCTQYNSVSTTLKLCRVSVACSSCKMMQVRVAQNSCMIICRYLSSILPTSATLWGPSESTEDHAECEHHFLTGNLFPDIG